MFNVNIECLAASLLDTHKIKNKVYLRRIYKMVESRLLGCVLGMISDSHIKDWYYVR